MSDFDAKFSDGQIEKESRSDIFLAEVQAILTDTLMASLSNCPTSAGEHVCTNLAHSFMSCSSVTVCVMELTAGHHFFQHCLLMFFPVASFSLFNVPFSPSRTVFISVMVPP